MAEPPYPPNTSTEVLGGKEDSAAYFRRSRPRTTGSVLYPRLGAGAVKAIAPRPGPPSSPAFRLALVAPAARQPSCDVEGDSSAVPGVPTCKVGVRLIDPAGYPSCPGGGCLSCLLAVLSRRERT